MSTKENMNHEKLPRDQWWNRTFYIAGVADLFFSFFLSKNFYKVSSGWNLKIL
jgi:hypothetical protein